MASWKQIQKCYDCSNPICSDTSIVPRPPYDMVIRYKEYYRDSETNALKLTTKEENTYYHPMQTCILLKHPSFDSQLSEITVDVGCALLPIHRSHAFDNFGICV